MLDSAKNMTALNAWRRAPALAGLVALTLLHVSAAAHQFEHSAEHSLTVCEACGAYSQLENTAVAASPSATLIVAPGGAIAMPRAAAYITPFAARYLSRAPPRS